MHNGASHVRVWHAVSGGSWNQRDLAPLSCLLELPLPRPFQGCQRISCGSTWPGPELEEILDFQAAAVEQPDHVAWPRWNSTGSSSGHSNRCMPILATPVFCQRTPGLTPLSPIAAIAIRAAADPDIDYAVTSP
jgi:hypothetical protein